MKVYFIDKLFDGENIKENVCMAVDKGIITWLGNKESIPYKKFVGVNLKGGIVTPGLIDCHVHIVLENKDNLVLNGINKGYLAIEAVENLKKLRKSGVVACRDLGSIDGLAISVANAINNNVINNLPIVSACGRAICATGGHGESIAIECDGVDECIKGARQVIKDGADCIKIMTSGGVNSRGSEQGPPELSEKEISAVVEQAHERGRKVAVHAHGLSAIQRSIKSSVDSIEHGVFANEKALDDMKEKGIFLVPTLSAPYYAVEQGLKEDPDNPDHLKSKQIVKGHNQIVFKAFKKGVSIAMGTDAGCPFNPYEKAYFELILLNRVGIPIKDVLTIGTKNGAKLLNLDNLGTLEKGKTASFIHYKNDVFEDIENLGKSKNIYIKGVKI